MSLEKKQIAKMLIDAGAAMDIQDAFGNTARSIAEKLEDPHFIQLIKEAKTT